MESNPDRFHVSDLGKTHYRYFEASNAPVVCILSGISIPSGAYCKFAQNLSDKGFSTLVIDYFGRGFSEPSPNFKFTLSSYVDQILDLLNALQIDKCILVSLSFGALIAANIAERVPSLISKLVFISPFHHLKQKIRPFQKFIFSSCFGEMMLKQITPQFLHLYISEQFSNLRKNEAAYWLTVGCCLQQIKNNPFYCRSISQLIGNFNENTIPSEMEKVTQMCVKTLVILGQNDIVTDVKESEKWWNLWMPNVKVVIREDVGHLLFLEEPSEVSELISSFLHL